MEKIYLHKKYVVYEYKHKVVIVNRHTLKRRTVKIKKKDK